LIGGGGLGHPPLPPDQAFGFDAIVGEDNTLLLRFTPAPGYYLYQARSQFRLDGVDGVALGAPRWPSATCSIAAIGPAPCCRASRARCARGCNTNFDFSRFSTCLPKGLFP